MFTKDRSREEDERVRGEIVRVKPDYRAGLTEEQVRTRVENGWTNEEVAPPELTTKEIIHKNVFTYFNLIFLVLSDRSVI